MQMRGLVYNIVTLILNSKKSLWFLPRPKRAQRCASRKKSVKKNIYYHKTLSNGSFNFLNGIVRKVSHNFTVIIASLTKKQLQLHS